MVGVLDLHFDLQRPFLTVRFRGQFYDPSVIQFRSFQLLVAEIADFLASCPSAKQLLQYRPSAEVQKRAHQLLEKNRDGSITKYEQWELEQFEFTESLMRLVKARVRSKKAS